MNEKFQPHFDPLKPQTLPGRVLRRRAVTLAASTAALGLAGCGMIGGMFGSNSKPESTYLLEADSRPVVLTKQQEVAKKAAQFAATVDAADKTAKPAPVILASTGADAVKPATPAETKGPAESKTPAETKTFEPASSGVNSATPVPAAVISPIATPHEAVTPAAMGSAVAIAAPVTITTSFPTPQVNTSVVASAVAPDEPSIEQALEVLRKHIAEKPTLNSALAMSLLDPAAKSPEALTKDLSAADQKLFADLLGALQTLPTATSSTPIAERAAPLVAAAKKWEADADLSLPKLVLASRVDSYGVYNAVEPKFETGKRSTVIIYCEVANFSSKKLDNGWYQTRLSQQETLITEDGLLVWRPNAEEVEDSSMNQRRDFYLVKKLTIPENLAAGKYTLRMSVTDKNSNKISMVSIPVEVTAR